ncbi:MAG: IS200/IS605 family transposase [Chlorobiales bacterium]|nr:IS200/IS605 family transposase [Chlorobiales bacterium]
MAFVRLWVHCIWATKNREKILGPDIRPELVRHMVDYARTKEIFIDCINGSNDHLHLLISLGSGQSVSEIVRILKGESAFWMNRSGQVPFRFSWQDDYFAASVSESQVEKVRRYIEGQIEHHRIRSFAEEYEEFLEKFGYENDGAGLKPGPPNPPQITKGGKNPPFVI